MHMGNSIYQSDAEASIVIVLTGDASGICVHLMAGGIFPQLCESRGGCGVRWDAEVVQLCGEQSVVCVRRLWWICWPA